MTALGIDPSFKATGFAWRPPRCQWRTFVVRGDDRPRLRKIIALAASEGCSVAALEAVFRGPNVGVSLRLARLGGVIEEMCAQEGINVVLIAPKTWQAFLPKFRTGESKSASIDFACFLGADIIRYTTQGRKVPDDNMADAVCLSEYQSRLEEAESV